MDNNYYENNNKNETIINGQVYQSADYTTVQANDQVTLFTKVFGWMFAGLLVTAFCAMFGQNLFLNIIVQAPTLIGVLFLVEFGLVMLISSRVNKMSFGGAMAAFFLYSAINGLTLSIIFFAYTTGTIYSAFGITAVVFGAMALIGTVTKKDLSSVGSLARMALIGLIVASVANIFLASDGLSWAVTYIGVLVFVALTAYDVQKIKKLSETGAYNTNQMAILGALILYLDFINLFIKILRILGRKSSK
jgi:Integral membrane protein, interacts with FtsH